MLFSRVPRFIGVSLLLVSLLLCTLSVQADAQLQPTGTARFVSGPSALPLLAGAGGEPNKRLDPQHAMAGIMPPSARPNVHRPSHESDFHLAQPEFSDLRLLVVYTETVTSSL